MFNVNEKVGYKSSKSNIHYYHDQFNFKFIFYTDIYQ